VPAASRSSGESIAVWTLWLTYGAFYFCRTNISAAVPGLKASLGDGGLGLSGDEVGWILASLKIAYGLGQLVNGQLSERISPRVMLAVGMFGSAALNVLFGSSTGFFFLLFVWATNGFCQSLGWTPTVRVVANWVPIARRGHAIGIIGTGYQITLGLTYVIAGQSAECFGWRGALYVPAAFLAAAGLVMLLLLRETPGADAHRSSRDLGRAAPQTPRVSFSDSLYWTLYNPTLWLLGLALGLLNACRYGYIDWGLTHLVERRAMPVGEAGLKYFVIAIGATAGAYLTGWATDRFFGNRRAPMICILMAVLGAISLVYDRVVMHSEIGTVLLLVVVGFCIYGPQVLLVGTAPADLAHRGTSAAAAGFVNFMGYMGAATGDVVTGYYSSPEHGGWRTAIYIWAAWAFAGSVVTAMLWNTTSRRIGVLPALVPKLAAMAMLLAAGMAAGAAEQPLALRLVTYAAAACLAGTFITRWAAAPGLTVALVGLLSVFTSFVQIQDGISWSLRAGMMSYALAAIATLMILVAKKDDACELS
jgi:OPA family glycerol-3-phosphate transporter-like MFS transporter